ncbi:MAG TPA: hypothetical protein IAB53_02055 [Candidatus Scybalocola faecipullorum]|nr:hypothetical protein [Candidatus Scybalocola faecipullorum]
MTDLSPQASYYLKWMLVMCTYYMVGKYINRTTISGIFCAGGDSKFGFLCDTVTLWCFTVPFGLLAAFVFHWPILAVYFIVNLDEIVKLLAVTLATVGHPVNPAMQEYMYTAPIKIGNNCWIGANAVICPGVEIGPNSVIGAGSVVVDNIPENCVAAGNPCRVIRKIGEKDLMYYFKDRKIDKADLLEEKALRERG